ncbi:MAG: DNA primase large subunit PriL [Methanoregula sp. PtaU1.Bin051]|nr:MAG: DNA primase large subunit PriL [Methanoregula sp. PtaU1.Bin051]
MVYEPSGKELAHFPFLKKANDRIRSLPPVETLLTEDRGAFIKRLAEERISQSLASVKKINPHIEHAPEDEIAGYILSRVIVSSIGERQLLDRLVRYEADRAYNFLRNEDSWNSNFIKTESGYSQLFLYIANELGIPIQQGTIPMVDYVELVSPIREGRFRLINRMVTKGQVYVGDDELYDLLCERIRVILRRDLPYKNVPKSLNKKIAESAEQIKMQHKEMMLENFGAVEETAFPPCIQALVSAITSGANLTHPGRFSLTAFLHTIGMDNNHIAGLYARAPDYDPEKTMYQVGHITGGGGTEYTAPACAAMKTTGLCVRPDKLCETINHPLSYYRKKKRQKKQAFRESKP